MHIIIVPPRLLSDTINTFTCLYSLNAMEQMIMARAAPFTALIADNHPITRMAICALMARHGFIVLEETGSSVATFQLASTTAPDIIILGFVPFHEGLSTLKLLRALPNNIPVLIFNEQVNDHYALRCFELGAAGLVSKKAPLGELIEAVKVVLSGHIYFPGRLLKIFERSVRFDAFSSQKTTQDCVI